MLIQRYSKYELEAGCDEAGRGCLAGPVFAAAVILSAGFECAGLNDSKKLRPEERKKLRVLIETNALDFAVASVDNHTIDKINILNASFLAMHMALDKLKNIPEMLLIDGNRFKPYKDLPHECIIGGDGKYASIAAASILAKTYRDEYMEDLHLAFPDYGWITNKGYATRAHVLAIRTKGTCEHHRASFSMGEQLKLDLATHKQQIRKMAHE